MTIRNRGVMLTLILGMLASACGSADSSDGADSAPAPVTEADAVAADTVASEPTAQTPDTAQDPADIDWATVDLNTIDWENIDVSQIDTDAVLDNPTVAELVQQNPEAIAIISEAMPAGAPGSATLTIGAATWEFDSFGCAFGHEATQSDVYSFSSNSFGEHEGARVQMQANIRDTTGQGRFEGEDLRYEVFINDIDDFENPSIDWEMESADSFVIDGDEVTVSGSFDDELTEMDQETVSGTLEATCGSQSRR